MKKFTRSSLALLLMLFVFNAIAQKPVASNGDNKQRTFQRCGTDEAIQRQMETDPEFRAMMEKRERDYQNYVKANLNNPSAFAARTSVLTGPVTIPVVVHIVLPNPNIITDADVEYFINRLNLDFSGLNPDSTNGAPFYNVRGHSLLRFQLARRDPSGNYTTGIERLSGTTLIGNGEPQAIKNAATATGGLNPWPFQQYYNLWVGASNGLLGIAPAIGVGTAASDGVCVNYQAFSNSGCGYTIPAFNLGRTAVHEIGHNFGLFHTFTACTAGADFGQLTSAGCTLPSNLLGGSDDTPTQGSSTSGCPSGSVASNCAGVPNPPGKMYQNYMDYTDDACYSMFTNAQVDRMHYILEFCRGGGYLTTQGHLPPVGMPALDAAAMAIVSPGGSELIGCNAVSYPAPVCPGTFQPKIRIENRGSSTITSITVALSINATVVATQTFTGLNIATYKNAVVTFTATPNLVAGANVILYTLSAPNGGTDAVSTNNTATTTLNISTSTAAPFVQNFTGTAFPPANMTNNLGAKWVRNAAGNGNAGSAFIDNYNNSTVGELSDLRSLPIDPGSLPLDSMIITWDLAHKNYGTTYNDTLTILVSNNCGVTFTEIWKRGGAGLATAGASTAAYTTPAAADWKAQRVAIGGSLITGGPIIVVFRNKNLYGNNIFLDNINVFRFTAVANDAAVTAIVNPTINLCSTTFTPSITVKNNGTNAITSLTINYQINASPATTPVVYPVTLAAGASTNITLSPVATVTPGPNTFKVTISSVNNLTDPNPNDNESQVSFTAGAPTPLPISEGFDGTVFPPTGWRIINPDNLTTWARTTLAAKTGTASARINIWNYSPAANQLDYLVAPLFNLNGWGGGAVSFHYAYKTYSATPADHDTLEVVVSTDCGTNWISLWKRGGTQLATESGNATNNWVPTAAQWTTTPIKVSLDAYVASGNILVAFRTKNRYGQNIYIDNVNITGLPLYDVAPIQVANPANDECSLPISPKVRVKNIGIATITSMKVGYQVNGGAVVSSTITGLNLPSDAETIVSLPNIASVPLGNNTFRVFTSDPNGLIDQNITNDTTVANTFKLLGSQGLPLTEGFEGSYPSSGWDTLQTPSPLDIIKWSVVNRTISLPSSGNNSLWLNNMRTPASSRGNTDNLITPVLLMPTGFDTAMLRFDVANAARLYPGSTTLGLDTLAIDMTKDCGKTWTRIYQKFGTDLQTTSNPNIPYVDSFFVTSNSQWRTESLNLKAYVTSGDLVRFRFRNTTNAGNNTYIDNINLTTKTLAAKLKTNGYMIAPNPVTSTFTVQHYLAPKSLRGLGVYNAAGQRIIYQSYNGNADSYISIDLTRFPAGVYAIRMEYTNKTVTDRVIKL